MRRIKKYPKLCEITTLLLIIIVMLPVSNYFVVNLPSFIKVNVQVTIVKENHQSPTNDVANEDQTDLSTTEKVVIGWEPNVSRKVDDYLWVSYKEVQIIPKSFCKNNSYLLVIIASAPENFPARDAIRNTWTFKRTINRKTISTYFILGKSKNLSLEYEIQQEVKKYGDIIYEDFVDTYNNLTIKSLMMLKLVYHGCRNIKYLLKTDDNVYVLLPALIDILENRGKRKLLLGYLNDTGPNRNASSPCYAPLYLYKANKYPLYLSGAAYVMTQDVVGKLYRASKKHPIFHLEDVYITGILARTAKIIPRHNDAFSPVKRIMDPCQYFNAVSTHYLNASDIYRLHKLIETIDVKMCFKNKNKY